VASRPMPKTERASPPALRDLERSRCPGGAARPNSLR